MARKTLARRRRIGVAVPVALLAAVLALTGWVAVPGRAGATTPADTGLSVAANAAPPGFITGVTATPDNTVTVTATGSATYGSEGGNCAGIPSTDPDGNRTLNGTSCGPKMDPNALDPNAPIGALVGSLNDGPWFLVGSHWTHDNGASDPAAGQAGNLNLAYNDDYSVSNDTAYANNTGSYSVQIAVQLRVQAVVADPGTFSGIFVSPGEAFSVTATGTAEYGYDIAGADCEGILSTDPDGNRFLNGSPCSEGPKVDPGATLGTAPIGALLAGFISGPSTQPAWFLAGSSYGTTATMASCGFLSFVYNDAGNGDNTGFYTVTVYLGTTTPPGGSTGPGGAAGATGPPPAVTSAAYDGTDSTGGHFVQVSGSGLAAAQTVIYGQLGSDSQLPPACPVVGDTLTTVTGPCSYALRPDDRVTGAGGKVDDTKLQLTTPPQADLAHVMVISPFGRSNTFAVTGLPAEPHLDGTAIISTNSDGSHEIVLWGSGLTGAKNVAYGRLDPPNPTLACPMGTGGLDPAGETCSYAVTASDLADNPQGPPDTNFVASVPPGADLSRVTVFGPGGWSNTVGVANLPAPIVTSAGAALNGLGDGTLNIGGTGLGAVTDILFGTPDPASMPPVCPYSGGNWLPVQTSSCVASISQHGGSVSPTFVFAAFPPGADLDHIVLLGSGGPSSVFAAQRPPAPVLSGISTVGTEPDGRPEVELTGSDLGQVSVVDFGPVPSPVATTQVLDDSHVRTEVPSTTGTVQVIANSPGGGSNPLNFTNPSLASMTLQPAQGDVPNPILAINGDGLTGSGTPQVFFGNIPSASVQVSGSTVLAQVPDLIPGDQLSQYVVVRTASGDTPDVGACPTTDGSAPPADCFSYPPPGSPSAWAGEFGPPVLVSTSAANKGLSGPAPTLTLFGSGFTGASQVMIDQVPLSPCGSGSGACFSLVDDGRINVTAPPESPGSYPVTVTNIAGTSNSINVTYVSPPAPNGAVAPVGSPPAATGPATPASGVSGQGPSFGPFSTAGSWKDEGNGVYSATGTVTLNGLRIVPDAGVTLRLDVKGGTLTTTGSVDVSLAAVTVPGLGTVGPFHLYHGSVSWTLSAGSIPIDLSTADIAGISLSPTGSLYPPGSPVGGVTPGTGGLALSANLTLPTILGGGTAQVGFLTTAAGIDPSSLRVNLGRVSIGGLITCDGCELRLDPTTNGWYVSGNLSGPDGTQVSGSITYANGAITSGTIRAVSTSLAGLVGVNNVQVDYQSGSAGNEHWSGQATDTSGSRSTFDFTFANGSLQTGSVHVPHASLGGVISIDGLDFEYANGNWSLSTAAAVSGIASLQGNLSVTDGVVKSGHVSVTSPALGTLVRMPAFSLDYDGSQPGTDKWSGQITDGSGTVDSFSFTFVDGALQSGDLSIPSASIAGVVDLSGVGIHFDGSQWGGSASVSVAGVAAGSLSVQVAYDASGQLVKFHLDVQGGQLGGGLQVKELSADYDATQGGFGGSLDVFLPGPSAVEVNGEVHFLHGAFQSASLAIGGNIPISPGLALRHGSLSITMDPLQLSGSLTVSAGPQVPDSSGRWVDTLDATGTLSYSAAGLPPIPEGCSAPGDISGNVGDWNICATLTLLGKYQVAQADLNMTTDGSLAFNGTLSLKLPALGDPNAVSFTAGLSGYVNDSGFGATAQASVKIFKWNPQAALAFSNVGIEGCGDTGLHWPLGGEIMAGFRDKWGQWPSVWGSCNVGDVSAENISSVRTFVHDAIKSRQVSPNPTFTVAPGAGAAAFAVEGAGGAASFTLVDPNGTRVDIPATTTSGTVVGGKVFVLEDLVNGTTYLIVAAPAPGTWTVTPDASSVPFAGSQQAAVTVTPTVTASVAAGAGAGQVLTWSASDQPGDRVQIREEGAGVVPHTIVDTTSASGTATFLPADGPGGSRNIVAEVDRGGLPVSVQTVTAYRAPAPTVPGAPTSGVAVSSGASALVSWSPPAYDGGSALTGYALTDAGGGPLGSVPATATSATVTAPAGSTVNVTPLNAIGPGTSLAIKVVAPAGVGTGTPVSPGGTVSTDPPGSHPSPANPVIVDVTSPVGGAVQITKEATSGSAPPAGYSDLGVGAQITAPSASASTPLHLVFTVSSSALPSGVDPQEVTVTRDGAVVAPCTAGSTASPDPCLSGLTAGPDGLRIEVLSSHASAWRVVASRVDRLAGADRMGTAIAVSRQAFVDGTARVAVLARADDYADALAGGPLAARGHGPVLLTGSAGLDPAVATELGRVLPSGSTVYLLGGTHALSDAVAQGLSSRGYQVKRLAGSDRYGTAVAVAGELGDPRTLLVTTGTNFADALSAGDAAAAQGGAVLLTDGDTLPAATSAYLLNQRPAAVYAVGGPAARALGSQATSSLVGADRYGTALAVAFRFFPNATGAGLASGTNYPDALAAGPFLAARAEPLLLSDPTTVPTAVAAYLAAPALVQVHLFGGTAALAVSPQPGGQVTARVRQV